MRLITVPGVFRPRSDSLLLASLAASRVAERRDAGRGATVLEPFTGSGVVALACARAGAERVSAIDVSRRAVASVRLNARLRRLAVRVLRGDLFTPVPGERFDLIVANPPYLPGEAEPPARGAARAWEGGADGRALLDRLCAEAAGHLTADGELLVVQSSVCGLERTLELLAAAGLDGEPIHRVRGPLGPLLAERAELLERRGLLGPGVREEEVQVIRAIPTTPPEGAAKRPHMSAGVG